MSLGSHRTRTARYGASDRLPASLRAGESASAGLLFGSFRGSQNLCSRGGGGGGPRRRFASR